jgi:hypothetical protein
MSEMLEALDGLGRCNGRLLFGLHRVWTPGLKAR